MFCRDAQNKLVEPNPTQTMRKAFNDVTPVVAFSRIWRWPDLNTHLELRPVDTCAFAFQHDKDQICVNPYHYERVVAPGKNSFEWLMSSSILSISSTSTGVRSNIGSSSL